MDLGSGLLGAGTIAGVGIALAFWRQAVGFVRQVGVYLVGRAYIEHGAAQMLFAYLASRQRLPIIRPHWFDATKLYVRSTRRREQVVYEDLRHTSALILYRGAPVLIAKWKHVPNAPNVPTSIWWVRGTLDIDRLLREAAAYVNEREHSSATNRRFRVIKKTGRGGAMRRMAKVHDESAAPQGIGHAYNDAFEMIRQGAYLPVSCAADDVDVDGMGRSRPFDIYPFPRSIMDAVAEARMWHAAGDWYKDRGIPWTRGWLLYGAPGTGKTILLRSLAQELDMPVFAFDLASMSNEDFNEAWNDVTANTPCMVVLEDIDGVFEGRKNVVGEQGGGLTFDCVLNCVSGVQQNDGVFLAITTNDLTKVDSAIGQVTATGASRPGRVDRVIEIGPMEDDCRRSHARRVPGRDEVEDIVHRGAGMTAAQFNDLCVREVLAMFWEAQRVQDSRRLPREVKRPALVA